MNNFFAFLGKLFVFVGIAGILIGGGYYLGTKFSTAPKKAQSIVITPTVVPTNASLSATPTIIEPEGKTGRFVVRAGGFRPFVAYTLSGVAGWTPSKTADTNANVLTLTKGKYILTISQGAVGASPCVFPGDKPQEMSAVLTSSTMIELLSGNPLRRGQSSITSPNETSFLVCQKKEDGSYNTFTDFGLINYSTPLTADPSILAEMDAMVGSLKKQ